jgi:hypothetical protein
MVLYIFLQLLFVPSLFIVLGDGSRWSWLNPVTHLHWCMGNHCGNVQQYSHSSGIDTFSIISKDFSVTNTFASRILRHVIFFTCKSVSLGTKPAVE